MTTIASYRGDIAYNEMKHSRQSTQHRFASRSETLPCWTQNEKNMDGACNYGKLEVNGLKTILCSE